MADYHSPANKYLSHSLNLMPVMTSSALHRISEEREIAYKSNEIMQIKKIKYNVKEYIMAFS